jgi:fatty-acyl-CoA synthase
VDKGVLPKEAILVRARLVESIAKTSVGKISKVAMREKYLDTEE